MSLLSIVSEITNGRSPEADDASSLTLFDLGLAEAELPLLCERVKETFGVILSIEDVLTAPDIGALASLIEKSGIARSSRAPKASGAVHKVAKWLSMALLLPGASAFNFELDANGCLTSFDANTDYYSAERRAMYGSASVIPAAITFATDFSIEYFHSYKVVRNLKNGHVYVLHQCGATNEPATDPSFPADAVGAPVFSVPAPKWSTGTTVPIAFLEELGVVPKASLIDMSYVTSACTQKLANCSVIEAMPTWNAGWKAAANASVSTVHFTDDWGSGKSDTAKDVAFDASSDPGALARAEWVKFVAAFFNLEAHANRIFSSISTHYHATEVLATAAVSASGASAPRVAWIQYSAAYSWSEVLYPASWKVSTAAYKFELVTSAGGINPGDSDLTAAGCTSAWGSYSCTPAQLKLYLQSVDAVIDETYSSDNTYTLTSFLSSYNFTAEDQASGVYPFFTAGLVLRTDRSMVQSGQYTFGNDWLEAGIVLPNVVLDDLVSYLHPAALGASYSPHFVRNIAASELVELVEPSQCSDPFAVCPGEMAPPSPPLETNYCLHSLCLIAGPPSPPSPPSSPPSPKPPPPSSPPPPPMQHALVTVMIVAGEVAEFTTTRITELEQTTASLLSIDAARVAVTVESGSVRVTTTIAAESEAAVATLQTVYEAQVGTTAAEVGVALSVSVENTPTFTKTSNTASSSSELSAGVIAAIVVSATVAVLLLVALCVLVGKEKQGTPVFTNIKVNPAS